MQLHKAAQLREELVEANRDLLNSFDPLSCIELLDSIPTDKPYHYLSNPIIESWDAVTHQHGEKGFETFQKITLLQLIVDFRKRLAGKRITESIESCYEHSFARIVESVADTNYDGYRTINDIFLKDLALCRQKLFPAGAQVVEEDSNFHRALIFRRGLKQATKMLRLLLLSGNNSNWLQIHTHLSELEGFNPEGWDQCYLRIADMMKLNPRYRGMWGGSWFYDPALDDISPRLSYLRKRPEDNGALLFYSNTDLHGGALATSKTRQGLYKAGKYVPTSYALIWPRKSLIQWADSFRAGKEDDRQQS